MSDKYCPFFKAKCLNATCTLYDIMREKCAFESLPNFIGMNNVLLGRIEDDLKAVRNELHKKDETES